MKKRVPLPVTVLGGYLGAGKTTLVNGWLASGALGRIGVLVNDFGDIAMDEQLIVDHDGRTLALANGCVCCSIGGDLGAALDEILGTRPRLDAVVIETSGVADPLKVASLARTWPGAVPAGVVVALDALTARTLVHDKFVGALVERQLRVADLVVATRAEHLCSQELRELEAWLAERSAAPVLRSTLEWPAPLPSVQELLASRAKWRVDEGAGHVPFVARTFGCRGPLSAGHLRTWLENRPSCGARVKGVVHLAGDDRRWVLQVAGGQVSFAPGAAWGADDPMTTLVALVPARSDFDVLFDSLAALVSVSWEPPAGQPGAERSVAARVAGRPV